MATPVDLRTEFNVQIGAYKASWHLPEQRLATARAVVASLDAHPWLLDQIPWDVHDLARADAKKVSS